MKQSAAAPIQIFVPFTRVDPEKREVEGYAFVNEEVPSQPGIRLKRAAMEAATPDYIQWGALREMHDDKKAAGKTNTVEWEDKGALIRTKVVDDAAWQKVVEGVYKGFSVGVRPKLVRNGDIEKCVWVENSLVDRPADPDAIFTLVRVDESETDDNDVEIITDETDPANEQSNEETRTERGYVMKTFGQQIDAAVKHRLRDTACNILWDNLWEISCNDVDDKDETARKCIAEFAEFIVPVISAGEMPKRADTTDLTRSESDYSDLLQRAETAETQLTEVRAELTAAREEASELKRRAAPVEKPPVRFPAGLDRKFAANDGSANNVAELLERRLAELKTDAEKETDANKRQEMAKEIILLEMQKTLVG